MLRTFTFRSCWCLFAKFCWNPAEIWRNAQSSPCPPCCHCSARCWSAWGGYLVTSTWSMHPLCSSISLPATRTSTPRQLYFDRWSLDRHRSVPRANAAHQRLLHPSHSQQGDECCLQHADPKVVCQRFHLHLLRARLVWGWFSCGVLVCDVRYHQPHRTCT